MAILSEKTNGTRCASYFRQSITRNYSVFVIRESAMCLSYALLQFLCTDKHCEHSALVDN